jgi:archaeosine-15-forming tRNA-guanine transglycosylase
VGSDVAIINKDNIVIATGRAQFGCSIMKKYHKGVAIKVREGIKSRLNE